MTEDILLIDDNPKLGLLFRMLLKHSALSDVKITHLTSPNELNMLPASFAPAIVFTDNRIPGFEDFRPIVRLIKDKWPQSPLILLTGEQPSDFGDQAEDKRLDGVWNKEDLSTERLVEGISTYLSPNTIAAS